MPLKVQVELQIQAVTCPGVFLPEKDDIYLSVSMLDQWKETECLPPVFPLLFHEKMKFEKVFEDVTDPAAVAELLECEIVKFELTQLTPPVGEFLAFFEDNTREFLFPEPKLTPSYPGVGRELLMNTVRSFPGIAPKIEFSTRTAIKEFSADKKKRSREERKVRRRKSTSLSPKGKSCSPTKSQIELDKEKLVEKATESSRHRSPSEYSQKAIHKRIKDNHQWLSQLSQGTLNFKSDIDSRPQVIAKHEENSEHFTGHSPVSIRKKSPSPANSRTENTKDKPLEKARALSESRSPSPSPRSGMCERCSDIQQRLEQLSQESNMVVKSEIEARRGENKELPIRSTSIGKRNSSLDNSCTTKTREKHFEKAAESSRSRSPSPCAQRSVCEPNILNHQRLSRVSHGDCGLKPDIDSKLQLAVQDEESKVHCRRDAPLSRRKNSHSPRKNSTTNDKHFAKATQSSKSRSPSPYTRRRMCELSNDNQQRLSQLSVGNFEFKSDIDARPPFVVRHVDSSKPVGEKSSSQLRPQSSRHRSRSNSFEGPVKRALSFESLENSNESRKVLGDSRELSTSEYGSSYLDSYEFMNFPGNTSTGGAPECHRTSSPSDLKLRSPILSHSALSTRIPTDQSNTWESIHDRVRNLLTSSRAKQRLLSGVSSSEVDDVLKRRSIELRTSINPKID
ncbi:spermatogenesis associated 6-like protein isoform X1 [Lissotriton helveticus]